MKTRHLVSEINTLLEQENRKLGYLFGGDGLLIRSELERLKMMYQSIKGARNAGTHGILSAPNVSGRQFNLWGAAAITTKGQMILADSLDYLEKNNIRVVYGDTDGIYLGCSKSLGNLPNFRKAFWALATNIAGSPALLGPNA